MVEELYGKVVAELRELADLGAVAGLVEWDQETMMPRRAAAVRSRQRGILAGLLHERFVAPSLREMVGVLRERKSELDPDQQVVVRETARDQDRAAKIPNELVRAIAELESRSVQAWGRARESGDYAVYAPFLAEMLGLKRQVADAIGYQECRYDALLDGYEPGMRASVLTRVLADLRIRLTELVRRIGERETPALRRIVGSFPEDAQERFGKAVVTELGFDFDAGRIDRSTHPFCEGLHPEDVRLTTRFNPTDLRTSLYGMIHEAGHGLYEQGLEVEHWGTPLGTAVSLGLHESQSRLWENIVARGRPFWEHFLPLASSTFGESFAGCTVEEIHREVNVVRPSLVRVEADEVTYNLHVILRYELECALLDDDLGVSDLPAAWNERMLSDLGVQPTTDAEGCLQDIHWSIGLIGYFPTYTLGNLYAASFWRQIRADLPDVDRTIARGEFSGLLSWLRERIHRQGRRYAAADLVERVTGRPPNAEDFTTYLEAKYSDLYGL